MTEKEKYAKTKLELAQKLTELKRKKRELAELEAIQRDIEKHNKNNQ